MKVNSPRTLIPILLTLFLCNIELYGQSQTPTELPSLVSSLSVETPIEFCHEHVPLKEQDVRERFEKELLLSLWDRPQVILWLKRSTRYLPHIEKALKESGMNWTSIWASYFMESWLSPALGFDHANGKVRIYGSGDRKISWVSFRDVAKFAVHALYSPAVKNSVLKIGGPQQLCPKEVVKIFEEVQGRKFDIEFVPVEKLKKQKEVAVDPFHESLAGLMLQYAAGDRIDMRDIVQKIHVHMTSVKEYARQMSTVSA